LQNINAVIFNDLDPWQIYVPMVVRAKDQLIFELSLIPLFPVFSSEVLKIDPVLASEKLIENHSGVKSEDAPDQKDVVCVIVHGY
jgi:hypothetical protein